MSPLRVAMLLLIALFLLPMVLGAVAGAMAMLWNGAWMMSRMLFPLLLVAAFAYLLLPRHGWHSRRRSWEPVPSPMNGTPEEILRQRYARGELTRDQHQEAMVEILKGRYVTGELTLEEYEARVGTLLGDSRQRRLEGNAPTNYL